mmetsp:Transcript_3939/g.10119  ORF Transcript_3939/g.10119 Transcript_3939/m.10119 type:complete len:190 (-) Transcript_3939:125-694(-)
MKHRAGPSAEERRKWRKFTKGEVARHGTLDDGWIIIYDRVYDITTFAITHPGWNNAGQVSTALAITRTLGTDCTEEFEYQHSRTAWNQLADFQIGVVATKEEEEEGGEALDRAPSHPLPSWLPDEVVNFWQTYKQGLTDQLCRYLEAAGYPQRRPEPQRRPQDDEERKGFRFGFWKAKPSGNKPLESKS